MLCIESSRKTENIVGGLRVFRSENKPRPRRLQIKICCREKSAVLQGRKRRSWSRKWRMERRRRAEGGRTKSRRWREENEKGNREKRVEEELKEKGQEE